jgi:hypothetical protein
MRPDDLRDNPEARPCKIKAQWACSRMLWCQRRLLKLLDDLDNFRFAIMNVFGVIWCVVIDFVVNLLKKFV